MMIQEAIRKVVEGVDLSEAEMMGVMTPLMEGKVTPAQIGAFLAGLRMKGESVAEIAGAARVMREKSVRIPLGKPRVSQGGDGTEEDDTTLVDTCGTGGDGAGTFNVSTTTAFVVAGAGLKVAKHGNRAVSSLCGSADVMEALGIPLELTPEQVGACIEQAGIGFLYAPAFHKAMRHAVGPRREIGLRTIFNLLGPLTNPAGANVQVIGVYREDLTEQIAGVLLRLGCPSAFVVYGQGGYDEMSITGASRVTRLFRNEITTTTLLPEEVGLKRADAQEILGGDTARNTAITLAVLRGERGAPRDMVLLNAAAALVAAERAETLVQGVALAAESIDSGQAMGRLRALVAMGQEIAAEQGTQKG